ncbi:P-loop containing nucleoside triphosphate hydrolase protein [Laetiporus sulphureus 93-53]|uniref:p-loop containing nucleoside triphosphate hydrolase protein n=1 Tax=Laetiporus sulphureus 93-53 TaxID=1314785 RepID=A0A165H1Z2_9APHY|nr:P-loop containing nucleoside triphosphate hydrolase protein [Laetiporus sulphureus 93-53]KZT11133.1 P-loop containing nucleoside triphosphate hydrolase protein [Laetiporus sulphureus 93-53]
MGNRSSRRRAAHNRTMAQMQDLVRAQQQQAEAAQAEQQRLEAERQRAAEQQRIAEEQRIRAEEEARRREMERVAADEARRHAEESARRAEELMRQANEDKHQAEELRSRAEEERQRAEAERVRADEEAKRARAEQEAAQRAREASEKAAEEARVALEKAEQDLREGIRPIVLPNEEEFEQKKKELQYQEGIFHFAIAGVSGSGKSSLLNAFRGLRNKDKGAAATGITETTSAPTRYPDPDPNNPYVWYDIPGAGTLNIPDWVYFNTQGLYIFDCIIVLFDNRFTETDVAILRNCARFRIPAYIVRSKSRQHIRNLADDLVQGEDESDAELMARAREQYISQTRQSVARNLDAAQLPNQRVYIVDKEAMVSVVKGKHAKDALDEPELIQDLNIEMEKRRPVE